jgi:hypothetical protein
MFEASGFQEATTKQSEPDDFWAVQPCRDILRRMVESTGGRVPALDRR